MSALLPGVLVGHDTLEHGPTGVSLVLLPEGATAGVDVRGAAPGTRETDLLDPVNTIQCADALVLAGGSAYGLASADGVMQWLEAQGRGVAVGAVRVPIVPAAVIFDLAVGDPRVRPDASSGARACAAAVPVADAAQGNVGAGAGASVGKLLGPACAMRGGVGIAILAAHGLTMAAVVVVNAVGDVVDPDTSAVLAGARSGADSLITVGATGALLGAGAAGASGAAAGGQAGAGGPGAGGSTTIGALVTDARLTKAQVTRLAQVGHDGLARTIRPVHTPMDGDTLFAAATGTVPAAQQDLIPADMLSVVLSMMAAEVTAQAVLAAVRNARGSTGRHRVAARCGGPGQATDSRRAVPLRADSARGGFSYQSTRREADSSCQFARREADLLPGRSIASAPATEPRRRPADEPGRGRAQRCAEARGNRPDERQYRSGQPAHGQPPDGGRPRPTQPRAAGRRRHLGAAILAATGSGGRRPRLATALDGSLRLGRGHAAAGVHRVDLAQQLLDVLVLAHGPIVATHRPMHHRGHNRAGWTAAGTSIPHGSCSAPPGVPAIA